MFQFGRFPSCNYFIHYKIHDSSPWGFPHSEIPGSMLIYSSPRLIAVSHVLLRLLMPRHSPCALYCLNFPISSLSLIAWVSQIIVVNSIKRFFLFLLRIVFRHCCDEIVVVTSFNRKDFFVFKKFFHTQLSVRFLLFFVIQFSMNVVFRNSFVPGGLKWTRTTDLALIRRAL